jgi:hypothetical protein
VGEMCRGSRRCAVGQLRVAMFESLVRCSADFIAQGKETSELNVYDENYSLWF